MKTICRIISVLLAAAFLAAMFLTPTFRVLASDRESGCRASCVNNMSQICLALINYEANKGHLPPPYTVDENGKPLHSWRTLLLPMLEYNQLHKKIRFDEPWDSEYNKQFHDIDIPIFRCKSADPSRHQTSTSYDVVIGVNTAFPPFDGKTQPKVSVEDIANSEAGTDCTIMLVERKTPVHWMEPSGIPLDDLPNEIDWRHNGGTVVGFADRSVRCYYQGDTPYVFQRLCEWKNRKPSENTILFQVLKENDRRQHQDRERHFFVQLQLWVVAVFAGLVVFWIFFLRMLKRFKKNRNGS